jgi:hypothetical protein
MNLYSTAMIVTSESVRVSTQLQRSESQKNRSTSYHMGSWEKQPEREVDCSPLFSAEVKNA